jgi:hypothetical protein
METSCRTCRKRKTRCDGGRPLCSTCGDNKIYCLGYGEVGEGHTNKKERINSKLGGETHEELREKQKGGQASSFQRKLEDGGYKHRRTDSKLSSILEHGTTFRSEENPASTDSKCGNVVDFRTDHRESAVYSDEGSSPISMLSPTRFKIIF